jgi:hypothetical protein
MKIKNSDVLMLLNVLENLVSGSEKMHVKFLYAVERNKKKLDELATPLQKLYSMPASEEIVEYENERVKLCVLHSNKDESGNAKVIKSGQSNGRGDKYDIKDLDAFNNDLKTLVEKYKTAIDEQKKKDDEIASILNEEVDIEFYKVSLEYLPEMLSAAHASVLFRFFVSEEDDEVVQKKEKRIPIMPEQKIIRKEEREK